MVWRNLFAKRFRDNGEEGARHGRSLINTGTFPLRTTRHWDGTTAAVLSWKGRSALSGLGNVDDGRTGWTLPPPRDSAPPPASSPSAGGRGYHSGVVLPIATVEAVAAVADSAPPAVVSSRERQQQRSCWCQLSRRTATAQKGALEQAANPSDHPTRGSCSLGWWGICATPALSTSAMQPSLRPCRVEVSSTLPSSRRALPGPNLQHRRPQTTQAASLPHPQLPSWLSPRACCPALFTGIAWRLRRFTTGSPRITRHLASGREAAPQACPLCETMKRQ